MWHLIPTEVRHELQYEIARHELEYADNYRAYRVRDNFLFDDWSTAYHQGCCGSFDTVITLKNGEKWIVGCNYGHQQAEYEIVNRRYRDATEQTSESQTLDQLQE